MEKLRPTHNEYVMSLEVKPMMLKTLKDLEKFSLGIQLPEESTLKEKIAAVFSSVGGLLEEAEKTMSEYRRKG